MERVMTGWHFGTTAIAAACFTLAGSGASSTTCDEARVLAAEEVFGVRVVAKEFEGDGASLKVEGFLDSATEPIATGQTDRAGGAVDLPLLSKFDGTFGPRVQKVVLTRVGRRGRISGTYEFRIRKGRSTLNQTANFE